MARKGARIVSALVAILQERQSYWPERDFIERYIAVYKLESRVSAFKRIEKLADDYQLEFPLLRSPYVRDFIYKQPRHYAFTLNSSVNKKTIIGDIGEEDLKEIYCYIECHWRP